MNKIIILIIIYVSYQSSLYSQITVIDKSSKKTIPFVNIQYTQNSKLLLGEYSNEIGQFILDKNPNFDRLIISCMGYNTIKLKRDEVLDTIFLVPKVYKLNDITLTPNKPLKLGFFEKNKKSQDIGVSNGLEIATFIKNPLEKEMLVQKFRFVIQKKQKDTIRFRIHVYSKKTLKKYSTPNIEISLTNNIFKIPPRTKGLYEIDITELNIFLPSEGAYFSIEGLDGISLQEKSILKKTHNNLIIKTTQSEEAIFCKRNFKDGVGWVDWNKWIQDNYEQTFNRKYDVKQLFVPMFGIEVKQFE